MFSIAFSVFESAIPFADEYAKLLDILLLFSLDFIPIEIIAKLAPPVKGAHS